EANIWLRKWDGLAIIMDGIQPFSNNPVGLFFGSQDWFETLQKKNPNVTWLGESSNRPGKTKKKPIIPQESWLEEWAEQRKKMILSHDKAAGPNIIQLDAEERRWVTPKKNLSEPSPDDTTLRWLTRYQVSENWKNQLEASLITLKTTQLHKFHDVIRHLNRFLNDKEIDPDIKPGENRLIVKLKNRKGITHSLDELSAGEHQVLILIYSLSRWLQPGGIVLIDEPDLFLHPSLINTLLAAVEQLVTEKDGQLLITSHIPEIWQRYENRGKRVKLDVRGES
ncbi:ATP-binding protein, partial [bacterium]|nr:ATP-binding protein [bacterium]